MTDATAGALRQVPTASPERVRSPMERWRVVLMVAATALALAAIGPLAVPATARAAVAAPIPLAGAVTVRGDHSAAVDVEVTQTTHLASPFGPGSGGSASSGGPPPLHDLVQGKGRFAGAVLERAGRVGALVLSMRDCGSAGCTPTDTFTVLIGFKMTPGVYQLYLITDGAPITVSLKFAGLSGTQTLTPDRPATTTIAPLPTFLPAAASAVPVYSAAGTADIGSNGGLLASVLSLQSPAFIAGAFGSCFNPGGAPPVYVASCSFPPGLDLLNNLQNVFVSPVPGGFSLMGAGLDNVLAGPAQSYGQGGWFDGAAVISSTTAAGLWLSFGPDTTAPAAPVLAASAATAPRSALPNTGSVSPASAIIVACSTPLLVLLRKSRRRRGGRQPPDGPP